MKEEGRGEVWRRRGGGRCGGGGEGGGVEEEGRVVSHDSPYHSVATIVQ